MQITTRLPSTTYTVPEMPRSKTSSRTPTATLAGLRTSGGKQRPPTTLTW
jgi:hypothetical protein